MVHSGDDERKQVPVAEVKPDSWTSKPSESTSRDDTVTLSKSQLRAFLEVIGQVGTINVGETSTQVKSRPSENGANDATMPMYFPDSASQTNGCSVTTTSQIPGHTTTCPLDTVLPSLSKQVQSSTVQLSPSKLSPLSKLEQKRMQWAKEKAEVHEWNPWGKPGAGAPTQRPVASVAPRTDSQLLMVQTATAVPYSNSGLNSYQSYLPSPTHYRSVIPGNEFGASMNESSNNKANSTYSTSLQPTKPVPPVFRSSIAFGTENEEQMSDESMRKQQWLRELDYQREDHKLRRLADQDHTRFSSLPDADWLNGNNQDFESISIVGDAAVNPNGAENQQGGRTYVRGQGFRLDPVSAAKAEERRQKAQEYQQAIRLQMEEKKRRLQEEKERKRREEEELECRLAEERAQMQVEYEQEQKRLKDKEEVEEKKGKVMFTAIQEAQAQAEAEKKIRKSCRQKPPTTENVQAPQDTTSSPEKVKKNEYIEGSCPEFKNWDQDHSPIVPDGFRSAQQTATVRPIQSSLDIPNSETANQDPDKISLSKELGSQTLRSTITNTEDSGYVMNRVLTPSFYRIKGRHGHRKDFGTQTDINYGKWIGDDAETTDHSCSSSISVPLVNRLTRVQHNKPYKASRHHLGSNADISDRPKWGVNQPSKSFIRMTDRDPHFIKRKKLQELRKQHWEKEMAVQQAIMKARRSINASYSSLRSRRIKSSSDGTAGFSSSEFETSQVRSHSPPRCNRSTLGYRSVCGSAEDVAYFGQSSTYTSTALPSVYRRRDSQSSDNLPSIIGGSEPSPSRLNKRSSHADLSRYNGNLPPMRRKWHSQEAFYPHRMGHLREVSPPVPAIQKRLLSEHSTSSHMSPPVHSRRKWSDQESFDLESVALSRAKSHRTSSDDGSDRNDRDSLSSAESSRKIKSPIDQNPLVHPEVVTGRPTPRQDRILQNLSSLRKGLMQKQRELENFIRHPPMS